MENKNPINAILENLSIQESQSLNEVRSKQLSDDTSVYRRGLKYYIKKGDTVKEISKDQYKKLTDTKYVQKKLKKALKNGTAEERWIDGTKVVSLPSDGNVEDVYS